VKIPCDKEAGNAIQLSFGHVTLIKKIVEALYEEHYGFSM
jgi:hypothetical protein